MEHDDTNKNKEIKQDNVMDCCKPQNKSYENKENNKERKKTLMQGLIYGTIPHIGCIMFIIGSILGVTMLMQFFKPLLMNRYFFHFLILISLMFATLSSWLYLRKNGLMSFAGMKKKWKYLSIMYGSTIGINLILFMLIFPMLANVSIASPTGSVVADIGELSSVKLKVDIPCPGHAPLISEELKTINGIRSIEFSFPNNFDVEYDSSVASLSDIKSLDVFQTYVIEEVDGEIVDYGKSYGDDNRDNYNVNNVQSSQPKGCSSCGSCSGACGGTCAI